MAYPNKINFTFGDTSFSDYQFPTASMFGDNSPTGVFGVPVDTLRDAGQSSTSDSDKLSLQNQYANFAASDALQTQLQGKKGAADIDARSYQNKTATDSQNALVNAQNAAAVQDRHGYSGGSFSSYSDGIYNYDPSIGGSPEHPIVSYNKRLSPQAGMIELQNQIGQQNAENQFERNIATSEHDRYNQGLLSSQQYQQQSNLQSSQLANQLGIAQLGAQSQKDIAQIDAQSRLGVASLGAQGSVLGSLFGSISGGQINGRYW